MCRYFLRKYTHVKKLKVYIDYAIYGFKCNIWSHRQGLEIPRWQSIRNNPKEIKIKI